MKKQTKLNIALGLTAGLALASALPIVCIQNTNNKKNEVVKTNNKVTNGDYAPFVIKDSSLNSNTIVSNASRDNTWKVSNAVDARSTLQNEKIINAATEEASVCTWYTQKCVTPATEKAGAMPDPTDGIVRIESVNQPIEGSTLYWNINNVGKTDDEGNLKNNSVRIWHDEGKTHQTKEIEFENVQCASTLYFLVSAANLSNNSAKLILTLNYTDGSTDDRQFVIKDWSKTEEGNRASSFYRLKGTGKGTAYTVSVEQSKYHLTQCIVNDIDTSKVLKSVTMSCEDTVVEEPKDENKMVFTVYGVTGLTTDTPTPKSFNYSKPTKQGVTLTWEKPEGTVAGYKLDVATDEGFSEYVKGFNNKTISESAETTSYTITSGLLPNTKYYARIRAFNSYGAQSVSSDTIEFTTEEVDVKNIELTDYNEVMTYGQPMTFTTRVVGEKIGEKVIDPKEQGVTFNLPEGLSNEDLENNQHKLTATKCLNDNIIITSKQTTQGVAKSITKTIKVKPAKAAKPTAPVSEIHDRNFKLTWDASPEASSYLVTVSTKSDLSNPVEGWNKHPINTNTVIVDGLKDHTQYYFGVQAVGAGLEGEMSDINQAVTEYTKIPTPSVTEFKDNKIKVEWPAVHDATKYKITAYTLDESSKEIPLIDEMITTNTYYNIKVSDVKNGDKVYVKVKAFVGDAWSDWCQTINYKIDRNAKNNALWIGVGIGSAAAVGLSLGVGIPVGLKNKKKRKALEAKASKK